MNTETAKTKVSLNGLRRNLTESCNELRKAVMELKDVISDGEFYDLAEAVNSVIQDSNILNCVFDPGEPEFAYLSHIGAEFIELED